MISTIESQHMSHNSASYPVVQILLSTYNGEKYLRQLLDSLLNQDYPAVKILVRDDGSNDSTVDILKEYKSCSGVSVVFGKNLGVRRSFFKLVQLAEANYYAFCDQDDIWMSDKISKAMSALSNQAGNSTLYCSAMQFVDERLNPIGVSSAPKHLELENAIVENVASGCTVVFDNELRSSFLLADPDNMHMHDWWLYLLASTFGNVIFDPEPRIKYRRHEQTVTGLQLRSSRTFWTRCKGFYRFVFCDRQLFGMQQAHRFGQTYYDLMTEKQKKLFDDVRQLHTAKGVFARSDFLLRQRLLCNDLIDGTAIKLLVLMGKY